MAGRRSRHARGSLNNNRCDNVFLFYNLYLITFACSWPGENDERSFSLVERKQVQISGLIFRLSSIDPAPLFVGNLPRIARVRGISGVMFVSVGDSWRLYGTTEPARRYLLTAVHDRARRRPRCMLSGFDDRRLSALVICAAGFHRSPSVNQGHGHRASEWKAMLPLFLLLAP